MSTYRHAVYMVLDQVKMKIDDNHLTSDHVIAILNKYRALFIKQRYGGQRKRPLPSPYYQTLRVEVDPNTKKSFDPIPNLIYLNTLEFTTDIDAVNALNTFKITLVHPSRLPHVGHNKYISTILYGAIDYDRYFKVKYNGTLPSAFLISAILDNPLDIIEFNELDIQDPLDLEFPIEEAALAEIIAGVVKEVAGIRLFPYKETNNAAETNLNTQSNERS